MFFFPELQSWFFRIAQGQKSKEFLIISYYLYYKYKYQKYFTGFLIYLTPGLM
jgi:hypothetical protein